MIKIASKTNSSAFYMREIVKLLWTLIWVLTVGVKVTFVRVLLFYLAWTAISFFTEGIQIEVDGQS